MQIILSILVYVTPLLLITGLRTEAAAPIPELVLTLTCKDTHPNADTIVTGTVFVSTQNKLLPGRSRRDKLPSYPKTEYEYQTARAELHVNILIEEDKKLVFDATPKGEGILDNGVRLLSAYLREEGVIIQPARIGAIEQFYIYEAESSEISIVYKTEEDEKKTLRKSIQCSLSK